MDRGLARAPGREQVQASVGLVLGDPFACYFQPSQGCSCYHPFLSMRTLRLGTLTCQAGSGAGDSLCCLVTRERLRAEQAGALPERVPASLLDGVVGPEHAGQATFHLSTGTRTAPSLCPGPRPCCLHRRATPSIHVPLTLSAVLLPLRSPRGCPVRAPADPSSGAAWTRIPHAPRCSGSVGPQDCADIKAAAGGKAPPAFLSAGGL